MWCDLPPRVPTRPPKTPPAPKKTRVSEEPGKNARSDNEARPQFEETGRMKKTPEDQRPEANFAGIGRAKTQPPNQDAQIPTAPRLWNAMRLKTNAREKQPSRK